MEHSWVTADVAAQMLRITPKTIRRMVADGRLTPCSRMPGARGAYFFDRADIEARLDAERAELEAAARAGVAS